jgi:hypothetical protein
MSAPGEKARQCTLFIIMAGAAEMTVTSWFAMPVKTSHGRNHAHFLVVCPLVPTDL